MIKNNNFFTNGKINYMKTIITIAIVSKNLLKNVSKDTRKKTLNLN